MKTFLGDWILSLFPLFCGLLRSSCQKNCYNPLDIFWSKVFHISVDNPTKFPNRAHKLLVFRGTLIEDRYSQTRRIFSNGIYISTSFKNRNHVNQEVVYELQLFQKWNLARSTYLSGMAWKKTLVKRSPLRVL